MKPSRVILLGCTALLLANLLAGCATAPQNNSSSVLSQPSADDSKLDGMWAMLQVPIYVGMQFLGSR